MTLELANRSITHPMGIAEDVVVRSDGFTFLADFVVVNFDGGGGPRPKVLPFILGRPLTFEPPKALIVCKKEKFDLRVGKMNLFTMPMNLRKQVEKRFVHAISVIDFAKDVRFRVVDELAPLDRYHPGNDDSTVVKDSLHEENFLKKIRETELFVDKSTCDGNVHQNSVIESLPISPFPVEDSEPTQEEIEYYLVPE
ncbi:hypothetical protein Tco_0895068 [Tanacetum coccineum]|uniref:Reverse transcriptase domain-containing protein n=1 Tax=Tanacetum coccineum TaxID=301880 RepID=A0ABQ5CDG3_9ASTR